MLTILIFLIGRSVVFCFGSKNQIVQKPFIIFIVYDFSKIILQLQTNNWINLLKQHIFRHFFFGSFEFRDGRPGFLIARSAARYWRHELVLMGMVVSSQNCPNHNCPAKNCPDQNCLNQNCPKLKTAQTQNCPKQNCPVPKLPQTQNCPKPKTAPNPKLPHTQNCPRFKSAPGQNLLQTESKSSPSSPSTKHLLCIYLAGTYLIHDVIYYWMARSLG